MYCVVGESANFSFWCMTHLLWNEGGYYTDEKIMGRCTHYIFWKAYFTKMGAAVALIISIHYFVTRFKKESISSNCMGNKRSRKIGCLDAFGGKVEGKETRSIMVGSRWFRYLSHYFWLWLVNQKGIKLGEWGSKCMSRRKYGREKDVFWQDGNFFA